MKKELKVGDVFTVEFIRNEKGGKPVCRIEGRVGFIDPALNEIVLPRSVWQVAIEKVDEKCVTVLPLDKVKTAWENLRDIEMRIKLLEKPKKERVRKPKIKYSNV